MWNFISLRCVELMNFSWDVLWENCFKNLIFLWVWNVKNDFFLLHNYYRIYVKFWNHQGIFILLIIIKNFKSFTWKKFNNCNIYEAKSPFYFVNLSTKHQICSKMLHHLSAQLKIESNVISIITVHTYDVWKVKNAKKLSLFDLHCWCETFATKKSSYSLSEFAEKVRGLWFFVKMLHFFTAKMSKWFFFHIKLDIFSVTSSHINSQ